MDRNNSNTDPIGRALVDARKHFSSQGDHARAAVLGSGPMTSSTPNAGMTAAEKFSAAPPEAFRFCTGGRARFLPPAAA